MQGWIRVMATLLLSVALATAGRAEDAARQIRQHAGGHRLLVLGEYHGTRETPLLVAQLVEAYSRDGTPVVLALELPHSEDPALAAYLDSDGDAEALAALRARRYWSVIGERHDGRRSHDMLELIEAVRALRAQGRALQVIGFDIAHSMHGNQARDDAMAARLRKVYERLSDNARLLVLTGNVHAMRQRPADAPAQMQQRPMAAMLADLDLYSVRLDARKGSIWACLADACRTLPLRDRPDQAWHVSTAPGRQYDLWVWLPALSVGRLLEPPRDSGDRR